MYISKHFSFHQAVIIAPMLYTLLSSGAGTTAHLRPQDPETEYHPTPITKLLPLLIRKQ
jgi:hypothetical protein